MKKMVPKILVLDAELPSSWAIIQSLGKRGFNIVAAGETRMAMSFFSKYVKRRIIYPSPQHEPDKFMEILLGLLRKEKFDVMIPIFDISSQLVSRNKELLNKYTKIPIVDYPIFMKCRDKANTMQLAGEIGVPIPKTFFPDRENLDIIDRKINYPVIIKPRISHGARGMVCVNNKSELVSKYKSIKQEFGECIVQEYIPHHALQYKAQFFLDKKSDLKAAVVYSKLRYFPVSGGTSSLNCTVERPDIIETGFKFLQNINWYGYADIDLIQDPRDGICKIMEINPRVTGSVKIAINAGVDFAYLLYLLAMNEEIPKCERYEIGIYLRYLALDIMWFIKSQQRFQARPSFFKFLDKKLSYQIFSLDDPLPAAGNIARHVFSLFSAQGRKYRFGRGWQV